MSFSDEQKDLKEELLASTSNPINSVQLSVSLSVRRPSIQNSAVDSKLEDVTKFSWYETTEQDSNVEFIFMWILCTLLFMVFYPFVLLGFMLKLLMSVQKKDCYQSCTSCSWRKFSFISGLLLMFMSGICYYFVVIWLFGYDKKKFLETFSVYHAPIFISVILYKEMVFLSILEPLEIDKKRINEEFKKCSCKWIFTKIGNYLFDPIRWNEINIIHFMYHTVVVIPSDEKEPNLPIETENLGESVKHLIKNTCLLQFWFVVDILIILARIGFYLYNLIKHTHVRWESGACVVAVFSLITYICVICGIVFYVETKLFIPLQQYVQTLKYHLIEFQEKVKDTYNETKKTNMKILEKFMEKKESYRPLDSNYITETIYEFVTKLLYLKRVVDYNFNTNKTLILSIVMQASCVLVSFLFRYLHYYELLGKNQNFEARDLTVLNDFKSGLTIFAPALFMIRLALISITLKNIQKKYIEELAALKILIEEIIYWHQKKIEIKNEQNEQNDKFKNEKNANNNNYNDNNKLYVNIQAKKYDNRQYVEEYSLQINNYIDEIERLTLSPKLFGFLPLNQVYLSLITSGLLFLGTEFFTRVFAF